ncbi:MULTISPECIES: ribonuclease domain-containing protein [Halomonas]|uniref:Ribonuclease domain-containing protein n=1 Tax=Halomonas tibetensis TaxID=2259590 RepID=A0ABV7B3R1_9GAMM
MKKILLVALLALAGLSQFQELGSWFGSGTGEPAPVEQRLSGQIQVDETLRLIERGGPFPHTQDGTTFHNRERLLPQRPRGYYREYTVETPGLSHRGARRIVTGGNPPEIFYYTDDHYASFRVLEDRR